MSRFDVGPEHYSQLAEEIRTIADGMLDHERAEALRRVAADYEKIGLSADRVDESKRRLKEFPDSV